MTYNEAFNKITEAYIKDEIVPMNSQFCFCGTLSLNRNWNDEEMHKVASFPYTIHEYKRMEDALFLPKEKKYCAWSLVPEDDYENMLWEGMCLALNVLKEIHKSRGEIIDEPIKFTKRQLV